MKPPESEPAAYIGAVLVLYVDLPDTPMRYSPTDLALARKLHQEGVPLALVESAFLLASLRRLQRPYDLAAASEDSILCLLHAGRQRTPTTTAAGRLPRLPASQAGQGRQPAG